MVNIRRPSKPVLMLNIVLCIFALTTTIYATQQYLYWLQRGHQHIEYGVTAKVENFTLQTGYVNFTQFDEKVEPSPVINITTYVPGLNLTIHSNNYVDLCNYYAILDLEVYDYETHLPMSSKLNLLSNSTLVVPLTTVGTYVFDYRIYYKPSAIGDPEILLDIAIQAPD